MSETGSKLRLQKLCLLNLLTMLGMTSLVTVGTFAAQPHWPQLGQNPQRWNYSLETIEPPYRLLWFVNFQDFGFDYRIYPGIQVVVANGNAYVGTKNGYFYALDAKTGKVAWRYQLGGPVMGTAACSDGKVFFGAMDGAVYALDSKTGNQIWKFKPQRRYGFSASVLLAEDKVFIPDRGGLLYAFDRAKGEKVWEYPAGTYVLHSPAYNNGTIYFGSEDGHVHAVDAKTGKRIWRSDVFPTHTFVETWPVISDGKVVIRFHTTHKIVKEKPENYYMDIWEKSLVILDEKTGKELPTVPQITTGMGGSTKPPPVTGDGRLVMPWQMGLGKVRGLVLMDLDKPEQIDKLLDADKLDWPIKRGPGQPPGIGSHQENLSQSVFGNVVINVHYHGFAWADPQTQLGAYHLVERKWYTAGRSGHIPEPVGGDREHNSQGSTSSPASAAYGRMYHQHWNTVCCWGPAEKADRTRSRKVGTQQ